MIFYLGTHRPQWLERTEVPLFLSRRTLPKRRLPRARGIWALDSGGFSELNLHGQWTVPAKAYVTEVGRYVEEIGNLQWAAVQDWMCEPVVRAKTGLSTVEHQARTIDSYLELSALAPELPWTPVLQGWEMPDYREHVEMYARRGVDLKTVAVVGIGSVCRRQATKEVEGLIRELSSDGIRLHGFGFKLKGLPAVSKYLESSDSLAWSFGARQKKKKLPECSGHQNCANCMVYALKWRNQLLAATI